MIGRAPLILLPLLLVWGAGGVPAQGTGCQAQGQVHVCQAEGFGTILNQDVAQAKDEAWIDARRRAVEQVAGVQVDAETITQNQVLFDDMVRAQARGVIQAERVLEEGPTGDGRFRVRIEAWVKAGEVQDRLQTMVSELSMIVLVPETNIGRPQAHRMVENEIVTRLVGAGYRVLDHSQVQRVAARDKMAALLRGDEQIAREIGLRFLANIILLGEASARFSQTNQGLVSAYASVTVRAMETETGRIIGNVALHQVRGFGRDDLGAGERALGTASGPAAERVVQALDGHFKRNERRIEVRLRGMPSLDEYRRVRVFLERQRWVTGVSEGGYATDEALLVLTYPEKTVYLAARVGREPRYRVLEFDRSRILVEYRP